MAKLPGSASDPLWYKDAIIYELHVRAFKDSNADGIGDFPGLLEKMDYLQDLGVTCLWLLPFFPSPLKDDGYDISDYLNVHPMYGTLEDFRAVLAAAHERGLQVMIELVVNHTSDQHPWFQTARSAPIGSPEKPLNLELMRGKFRDCAANAVRPIAATDVEAAVAALERLEELDDVGALTRNFV